MDLSAGEELKQMIAAWFSRAREAHHKFFQGALASDLAIEVQI